MTPPKTIIWMLQANQTTPIIKDFLVTLQTRLEKHINLKFWTPDTSSGDLEKLKELNPAVFKTTTRIATFSHHAYMAKKAALGDARFSEDLLISDTLLLDDLSGGNTQMTTFDIAPPPNTCGMIVQVPSPLGSSEVEERNFHAAIIWARQHKIPAIGYELLPMDTKWTLAPALPDGIITRYPESHDHLKSQLPHSNIWLLPTYEGAIFSSVATNFHLNGVRASYHYRNQYSVSAGRTVLYLPHNVAMLHEYKKLIQILAPEGSKLHLMFGVGKDQVRGGYTHEQMIRMIYREELAHFASHSFHNANNPWEMMMADAVVACASGLHTMIGEKELPCIIFDPQVPEVSRGYKKRVQTEEKLLSLMKELIDMNTYKVELADILMLLAKTKDANA